MIGLSRVASWKWLLPPASVLTPASVVVVVAVIRSRTAARRSTVILDVAFAHLFFSDGGRRVLLIELNPCPLRIAKCLTQVGIVTALEYSGYPSDVGHRSSKAPLAYGSEFGVQLAMHRSHALVDPPSPDCTSSIPGPPCLMIGVVFVAGVGCGLIFRYHIKFDDG
jgi:hypothetical protein